MLTGMVLPYRTCLYRCVMWPYPRRLLVVYLTKRVMRRPQVVNKQLEVCAFCMCIVYGYDVLPYQQATYQPTISKTTRKRHGNDTAKGRQKDVKNQKERRTNMQYQPRFIEIYPDLSGIVGEGETTQRRVQPYVKTPPLKSKPQRGDID